MHQTATSPTPGRRLVRSAAVLLAIILAVGSAATIGTLASRSASSWAPSFGDGSASDGGRLPPAPGAWSVPSSAPASAEVRRGDGVDAPVRGGAVTEDDGVLPDGVTVFDDEFPGVSNLDPALLTALRAAARAAGGRVAFVVNSGWRSAAYQDALLDTAISRYGSEPAAERWVATAATSPHVAGDAVDLGADAAAWLSEHGARFGLCQIYRNEPWHFELRPNAIARGCPSLYADPTRDPRMR